MKEYATALKYIRALLQVEPGNRQAQVNFTGSSVYILEKKPLSNIISKCKTFIQNVFFSGAGGYRDQEAGKGRDDWDGGGRGRRGRYGGPSGAGAGHGGETDDEEVIQGPRDGCQGAHHVNTY